MKINAQPVRGTKDFLPNEAELRDYVQGKIADTYKQYGFQKIGTPAMEDIERLNKKWDDHGFGGLFCQSW